ncbi:hypothetical protein NNO_1325 [Hydrogenimonas sp.]|nr:hypothetical protein NNO_1325 [Hydrogenimonas sp.]
MTDGVIKYGLLFEESGPLEEALWRPLEPVRSELYEMGLIGVKEGIGYGNVSRRISSESFVITATQTGHLPRLDENCYSLVESYDEERFIIRSKGPAKPSSEAFTHAAVYALSQRIEWVIHIHSMRIWKMMLAGDYLKTAPVPYGTKEMALEVKRLYEGREPLKNPLFAMAGHEEGVILFGRNAEEAMDEVERVSRCRTRC